MNSYTFLNRTYVRFVDWADFMSHINELPHGTLIKTSSRNERKAGGARQVCTLTNGETVYKHCFVVDHTNQRLVRTILIPFEDQAVFYAGETSINHLGEVVVLLPKPC
jgi:hypothetical protein